MFDFALEKRSSVLLGDGLLYIIRCAAARGSTIAGFVWNWGGSYGILAVRSRVIARK